MYVQYYNAFKMLLGLPKWCSASATFAEAQIDGFQVKMRKKSMAYGSTQQHPENGFCVVIMYNTY